MAARVPPGGSTSWLGTFGEVWFHTLCVAAHLVPLGSPARLDVYKTDCYVTRDDGETLRVQVKTTERPTTTVAGYSFPLEVETYDRLRVGASPGFLVLVVVHRPHPRWTTHYGAGSLVRASAYWAMLDGAPETTNQSTVTITLPSANMLTPASIRDLYALRGDNGATG